MYYFILAIVALALVGDFVVCLQKHKKNNEVSLRFYRKSMFSIVAVFAGAMVCFLMISKVWQIGLIVVAGTVSAIMGMFVHWFIWTFAADVAKKVLQRQS